MTVGKHVNEAIHRLRLCLGLLCMMMPIALAAADENMQGMSSSSAPLLQNISHWSAPAVAKPQAQVAFQNLSAAYFTGDTLSVNVSVTPMVKGLSADLYVVAWLPSSNTFMFFSGNPGNPVSFKPLACFSNLSVVSKTYSIIDIPLPLIPQGMGLNLLAALVDTGQPLAAENLLSNVAQTQIKLVGTAMNSADRDQAAIIRAFSAMAGATGLNSKIDNGAIRWMNLNIGLDKSLFPKSYEAEDVALALLAALPQFLRLDTPKQSLRLVKRAGTTVQTLTFRQYYQDIPVYGSWFQVVIAENSKQFVLRSLSGKYIPDLFLSELAPQVSEQMARHGVRQKYGFNSLSELRAFVPTKLWVYDAALLAPQCPKCQMPAHQPTLAWRVTFNDIVNGGVLTDAWVDADTGEIIFNRARYVDAQMRIWTADGNQLSSCIDKNDARAWLDEDGVCESKSDCDRRNVCAWDWPYTCPSPNAEGYDAYDYTWEIHRFYESFGRRSYDDHYSIYRMYLDVDFGSLEPNAMSEQCGAYEVHKFSDNYGHIDVMGHEVGHSFHWSEFIYDYSHQPGAIAEHIADMFGHFVGYWSGIDTDWQMGEDVPGGPIRDMQHPSNDHISDYIPLPNNEANDFGGVHRYSTIPSKAAYLMTAGDTHNSMAIEGIGETKSREIYYRLVTDKLADTDNFDDLARKIRQACQELIGEHGITANDCCQVRNAFAAVGLSTADSDCDGALDTTETDDDGDGIDDAADNCQFMPNPTQADTDGDGQGDACDADIDGDGRANDRDNCPYAANNAQVDWNRDGQGDACDDSDHDGTVDQRDNCRDQYNRDQLDSDRDGSGDVCDDDMDGDGIGNDSDNCPAQANADQADADGDGVGDICDNCPATHNPAMMSGDQPDLDGDGQGDACDDDIDGDGVANDDDACPEEEGSNSELCLAPPGEYCRGRGCPNGRLISGAEVNAHFNWDHLKEAHPAFIQPMGRLFFDPCQTIDCDPQGLFDDQATVQVGLDLAMALPETSYMDAPIAFNLAVVDERGNLMAAAETHFVSAKNDIALSPQLKTSVALTFSLPPAFAWRQSGQLITPKAATATNTADRAALPAFYLIIEPWSLTDKNRALLSATPLSIKPTIKLLVQK